MSALQQQDTHQQTNIPQDSAASSPSLTPARVLLPALLPALVGISTATNAAEESVPRLSADGNYRSSEAHTHDSLQLGQALSLPAAPDPAQSAAITATDAGSQSDIVTRHSIDWYLQDTWISDIGILLFHDDDQDGYFSGFSLSVDVDSTWSHSDVYLNLFLQRDLYPIRELHTSAVFEIYERTAADEYRIDIELVQNHAIDQYDLMIEVRDAHDHQLLDQVGAADFANLRALPLESEDLDRIHHYPEPIDEPVQPIDNDDIRVREHAGALGWLMMLMIGLLRPARVCLDTLRGSDRSANRL